MSFRARQVFLSTLVLVLLVTGGCNSVDDSFTPYVARIYLEDSPNLPPGQVVDMILPISRSRITVQAKPIFSEWDIVRAVHFETELGRAMMLLFTPAAAADLYRKTISNQGRTLVLTINGLAVGGRYIEGPIEDGRVAFFLEIDQEEIPAVVDGIQETSNKIQERAQKDSAW